MSEAPTLDAWINHVFDHSIDEPQWYFALDTKEWDGPLEQIPSLIAETFERNGELLARFSDEQLNQGFWFLVSDSGSGYMTKLLDHGSPVWNKKKPDLPLLRIPQETRLRALRSFVPLFKQVMAVRCTSYLSRSERWNPLNLASYMWWDMLPIHGCPEEPERAQFDAEVLVVLRRLLAIPHDACRESALHGIGHWVRHYPQLAEVVDEFLSGSPDLRPELIAYAKQARIGMVE